MGMGHAIVANVNNGFFFLQKSSFISTFTGVIICF